jgi:hemolysin activation/secretion protein
MTYLTVNRAAHLACALFGASVSLAANGQEAQPATVPVTADAVPEKPVNSEPQFFIEAFDVSGSKLLSATEIEDTIYPFLGPGRTRDDIEKARKALEDKYRSKGRESVIVEIPTQTDSAGNIRLAVQFGIVPLKVSETPVGRLRIVGADRVDPKDASSPVIPPRYNLPSRIREQVPSLKEGTVPDFKQVQAELTEANRNPDRQITPVIRAGVIPGTIDVDLKLKETLPLHGSLELNNEHSRETEALRLAATLRYTNLWQLGHSVSASYLVSPQNRKQTQVYSGSYLAPIWNTPWTLLVYGYKSNSSVASLGGTNVLGDGYSVGARALVRLPSGPDRSHSFNFGVDYKNFKEDIFIPSTDPAVPNTSIKSPLDYPALVGAYTYSQAFAKTNISVTLGATAGLRGIGLGDVLIRNKRADANGANASSSFFHFNLDASLTQQLGGDFNAFAKISGQLADSPLLSNEQIGAGGASTVRGYYLSEAVGDDGLVGGLEVRSPSFAQYLSKYVDELRLFAFADAAYIRYRSPGLEQTPSFSLVGLGVGARFQVLRYFTGDLSLGIPVTDGASSKPGDKQFHFTVKAEF